MTPPKPELDKVVKAGGLYSPKTRLPSSNYDAAVRACQKLRSQNFANLGGWTLASSSQVLGFRGTAVSQTKYWSRGSAGDTAPTVNLTFGQTKDEPKTESSPRPFCVTKG